MTGTEALNIGDREQVERTAKRAKLTQSQEENDFRELMKSPAGRRFMWRLLGITHVFESSFTGNSATFFKEGERNVGLMLLNDINRLCPETYFVMVRENSPQLKEASNG